MYLDEQYGVKKMPGNRKHTKQQPNNNLTQDNFDKLKKSTTDQVKTYKRIAGNAQSLADTKAREAQQAREALQKAEQARQRVELERQQADKRAQGTINNANARTRIATTAQKTAEARTEQIRKTAASALRKQNLPAASARTIQKAWKDAKPRIEERHRRVESAVRDFEASKIKDAWKRSRQRGFVSQIQEIGRDELQKKQNKAATVFQKHRRGTLTRRELNKYELVVDKNKIWENVAPTRSRSNSVNSSHSNSSHRSRSNSVNSQDSNWSLVSYGR